MKDIEKYADEILEHPLLNEDGSLNELCITELNSTIRDMPTIQPRLRRCEEWNQKKNRWTFVHDITGAFAKWAVQQSPYACPDKLEEVIKYLDACLNKHWESQTKSKLAEMIEISLIEIEELLWKILDNHPPFVAWNERKNKREGNGFSSRHFGRPDPDDDFIDLHALIRNVSVEIRNERRAFDKFNKDFEEKQTKNET